MGAKHVPIAVPLDLFVYNFLELKYIMRKVKMYTLKCNLSLSFWHHGIFIEKSSHIFHPLLMRN